MVDNDTFDVTDYNALLPSTPPTTSSFKLRSSEYYLEKLSNGKIYCKIYLFVELTLAPSDLTSNFDTQKEYGISINLPITLSKIKNCTWTHYDMSVSNSCVIASLFPTTNLIRVCSIQKVSVGSSHLTTGEVNDIIITVEGTI